MFILEQHCLIHFALVRSCSRILAEPSMLTMR